MSRSSTYTVKDALRGKELICHPNEFEEIEYSALQRKKNVPQCMSNPYSKTAYVYTFSDDSDFE